MLSEVWPFVRRHGHRRVVLARLIGRDGPGSRPLGATMAVAADGSWCGSISGGCVEGIVLDEARAVLSGGEPHLITVSPGEQLMPWEEAPACGGVLHVLIVPAPPAPVADAITAALDASRPIRVSVSTAAPWTWSSGPARGDVADSEQDGVPATVPAAQPADVPEVQPGGVFAEELRPGPRLIVAGATDLSAALAALGHTVGRRVEIVDPRPSHARAELFPGAVVTRVWPDEWLGAHPPSPADAVVAITHDPRIDDRALRAALPGPAGYVGALGSRATHAQRLRRLSGTPGLDRLAGPAGLDLGGTSIAETALSVLAEVVAAGHGRSGGRLADSSAPIQAAASPAPTGPHLLGAEDVTVSCAL